MQDAAQSCLYVLLKFSDFNDWSIRSDLADSNTRLTQVYESFA